MMRTFIIMMGIQSSGKSTFRELFLNDGYNTVNEAVQVRSLFADGVDVIFDAVNGSRAERESCIEAARSSGYRVIGYYLDRDICQISESLNIPIGEIEKALEQFDMPDLDEGYDELYRVENDGEIMSICPWGEENDELFGFDFI